MTQRPPDTIEAQLQQLLLTRSFSEATTLGIEAYGPSILGMLVGALGDEDAAEDVYAVWCEDVWNGIDGFEGRSRFSTWAYRVAYNALSRYHRTPWQRHRLSLRTGDDHQRRLLEERIHVTTAAWRKTTVKDAFQSLRKQLTPTENTLIILRIDRGLSWREIAQIMIEADDPSAARLQREANRLAQVFHRTKQKLHDLARDAGLL